MSIANDSFEPSTVESTCETLLDRVLKVCDEWLPCEPRSMRWKAAYSEAILDSSLWCGKTKGAVGTLQAFASQL